MSLGPSSMIIGLADEKDEVAEGGGREMTWWW